MLVAPVTFGSAPDAPLPTVPLLTAPLLTAPLLTAPLLTALPIPELPRLDNGLLLAPDRWLMPGVAPVVPPVRPLRPDVALEPPSAGSAPATGARPLSRACRPPRLVTPPAPLATPRPPTAGRPPASEPVWASAALAAKLLTASADARAKPPRTTCRFFTTNSIPAGHEDCAAPGAREEITGPQYPDACLGVGAGLAVAGALELRQDASTLSVAR